MVVGLKEVQAEDVETVKGLIEAGATQRTVAATSANADSSRSHSIMQFALKRNVAIAGDRNGAVEARLVRNAGNWFSSSHISLEGNVVPAFSEGGRERKRDIHTEANRDTDVHQQQITAVRTQLSGLRAQAGMSVSSDIPGKPFAEKQHIPQMTVSDSYTFR